MMNEGKLRLAVIIGSVREGRFGSTVADWFRGAAEQHSDFEVDLVDLAEFPLPDVLTRNPGPDTTRVLDGLGPRLESADAFAVVTPEYNHSYPAALKSAIDWNSSQWRAKPIGFVSYGGMAGGLRAVEHLRHVFAEMHAVTVRNTVSLHNPWGKFDAEGRPDSEECNLAAEGMLDQLTWWGRTLLEGREKRPYTA